MTTSPQTARQGSSPARRAARVTLPVGSAGLAGSPTPPLGEPATSTSLPPQPTQSPAAGTQNPAGGAGASPAPSAGHQAMAAAMSEDRGPDSLDAHIRCLIADLGLLAYHTKDSRRSPKGYPDWTIVGKRVIFRELKTEKGRTTPEQRMWLYALRDAGADAKIWRPSDLLSGTAARELAELAGIREAT